MDLPHFIGEAVSGSRRLSPARILIRDSMLYIWTARARTLELAVVEPLEALTASRQVRTKPHVAMTSGGETWTLRKAGCGCGSPLKSMNVDKELAKLGVDV